jgi:hypothetical protein
MELEDYKVIRNFISQSEVDQILNWVDTIEQGASDPNYHLAHLSNALKGRSMIFDISKTTITKFITDFQSVSGVSNEELPDFIYLIIDRIAKFMELPTDNIFLQVVDMNKGGKINPHYDAALDGYINYKCNISVLSENYDFHIDRHKIPIEQKDLYCFEASLYKHWTNEFASRRVLLSFGFIVPYEIIGRGQDDPRVRLSKRIEKYFQKNN